MQGQAADIAIQAEQIVYLKRMMAERIAFHTGQPIERIEADSDRDRWFTAEEAKEYGFIDQVIDRSAAKVRSALDRAGSSDEREIGLLAPIVTDVETSIGASRPAPVAPEGVDLPRPAGVRQRSNVRRVVSAETPLWRRLADIWSRRELLVRMVRTEIKVKYKNSVLGLMWSMLNPALNLAVYFVVFQVILPQRDAPSSSSSCFPACWCGTSSRPGCSRGRAWSWPMPAIVKKVDLPPRDPVPGVGGLGASCSSSSSASSWCCSWSPARTRRRPGTTCRSCLLALAAIAGLLRRPSALFLSAVNVYLRDTQHLVEVLMTAWFWAFPIVYPYRAVHRLDTIWVRTTAWLYFLNPLPRWS